MRLIDLTDKKFERWTVLRRAENSGKEPRWLCECDCGQRKTVEGRNLRNGRSGSCGCLMRELNSSRAIHGLKGTLEYNRWCNMRDRCNNPNNHAFADYGGRGITICEQWDDVQTFLNDMGLCPEGHSLERINNDAGYHPSNCKWATRKEQAQNKRNSQTLTHKGKTQCVAAWAEELGVNAHTIYSRIYRGWPAEQALTEPVGGQNDSNPGA